VRASSLCARVRGCVSARMWACGIVGRAARAHSVTLAPICVVKTAEDNPYLPLLKPSIWVHRYVKHTLVCCLNVLCRRPRVRAYSGCE